MIQNTNTKLGAVITKADNEWELGNALNFLKSAGSVFCYTKLKAPADAFGFNVITPATQPAQLKLVMTNHLLKVRGREMVGIVMPNMVIPTDYSAIHAMIGGGWMGAEQNWAFRSGNPAQLMVVSLALIPHIVRDVTNDVMLSEGNALPWLTNWASKTMLPHKFIDMTKELPVTKLEPTPEPIPEAAPAKKKK